MIPFLSSTLLDLVKEREIVLAALRKKRLIPRAMEDFLATPRPPSQTAINQLRQSDVLILVIGFKAGTLLPDDSGSTYTSAEYDEAIRIGKEVLVFIKTEKQPGDDLGRWRNDEDDPEKRAALADFKARASANSTPAYFDTPEKLALDVILALSDWEDRGRPGARKTFASTRDFFAGKNPVGHFELLDFGTTLLGRDEYLRSLDIFGADETQRVCILSGRGGIGKSKILHDWANKNETTLLFLKDEPLWHEDSEKEIPVECTTIVVDDAHRQNHLNQLLQLVHDTAGHRNLKLILSTRPGSAARLAQQVGRRFDRTHVTELPELKELTRQESRELAEQVLGPEFAAFAAHLAEIGSNSPLVIVAGGRLIASRKLNPSTLTTLDEFRSTIFDRLLDEMDLKGPRFKIEPFEVLDLIAALGPVDVESSQFLDPARQLFGRPVDEILATVDELAVVGVITPRPQPVRIIPDVLSDYLLERRCVSAAGRSTQYADRIYQLFGAHFLKNLMRNLAELDFRRGRAGETGLKLLDSIWADIHHRFREGDEYARHDILTDLSAAAVYQPDHVISLVRFAIGNPVLLSEETDGSSFRGGQGHVLSTLPLLLEAIAYHPERRRESVTILWDLAKGVDQRAMAVSGARNALKRLSAWHRYGDPALNFGMLVEAVRLTKRPEAFTGEFTPFDLISEILEREGEFNEMQDENTMSFGGFGLNYVAVGPVRQSAIAYLESALDDEGAIPLRAVALLESLLHNFMNRVGRQSTEHEREWQRQERERCLDIVQERLRRPMSAILHAKLFDCLRSATAISCPEYIRDAASAALARLSLPDEVSVIDAICTADHNLPIVSADFSERRWEEAINAVVLRGRSSLERIAQGAGNQARFTIDTTQACMELEVKTGGFHRFMLAFQDRPEFLAEVADQLINHRAAENLTGHLSSVFHAIHLSQPSAFRERALAALQSGVSQVIHAAANNLRVFDIATESDIAVIQAYAGYPDPVAKRGAIFAISYMGKFAELRQALKDAALSIRTEGDEGIAADLAGAMGPYGIPLSSLTKEEAALVASEFLYVRDWDTDQGSIPRFLSSLANLFPDQVFDLLLRRIEISKEVRANSQRRFRIQGLVQGGVSFAGVPPAKRHDLARECLNLLLRSDHCGELAQLFWEVAGCDDDSVSLVLEASASADDRAIKNICVLIDQATPRLAFTHPKFVKTLLARLTGESRQRVIDTLANQARRLGGGLFVGRYEDRMAQEKKEFNDRVTALEADPDLDDLVRVLRSLT